MSVNQNHISRLVRLAVIATSIATVAVLLPAVVSPAAAQDPVHVTFRLEGCRGSAGLFPALGPFICPDSLYTTGNLGAGWNELDRVPHRITTESGSQASATTTYKVAIVADNIDGGVPGYDDISAPTKNISLSHSSCSVAAGALQTVAPGIGGTDTSIYRILTISQNKGTTCVFDYNERLALGSSGFPGSSLHSNLTNEALGTAGIGARDVSIPVKEIAPQSIEKTMQATQGGAHDWLLTKQANPLSINFANTCDTTPGALQKTVQITITWTKLDAVPGGPITIATTVTAINPAHRPLIVNVTDEIRNGTTVLDTANSGDVLVEPGSEVVLVHQFVWTNPPSDPSLIALNDIATAVYKDPVNPGIILPGNTTATATATVQQTGANDNATVVITDTESLTGSGLKFSVAAPSVGSFTNYTAGTQTTGPVNWSSGTQATSGSVTFTKTVYVSGPIETSGTLSDTATLTGSEGLTKSANASTSIVTDALVNLTVRKTIPNILTGGETATFVFDVKDASNTIVDTVTLQFSAGQTVKTGTAQGLDPGTYTVVERQPAPGWAFDPSNPPTRQITIGVPACAGTVEFSNTVPPARARVIKTVVTTTPGVTPWQFCLSGPGISSPECKTVSPTGGTVTFDAILTLEGTYTVTETSQSGFDVTPPSGTCSFTVNFPADGGKTFTCTFTNVERGDVRVIKTQNGAPPTLQYTFCVTGGPDSIDTCQTTSAANGGVLNFTGLKPSPPPYTLCEKAVPAGTHSTLQDQGGVLDPTTGDVCLTFSLQAGELKIFTIDNQFPEGEQRTIGYWKNWNTCDGKGNQVANAAKTGNHLMDEFLPITIGSYTIDTCAKGVAVLSAASGKYAENQLAAQLFGAKLNVAAGAGTCTAANNAITQGDGLLIQIGYAGPPSAIVGNKHPLRNQILSVASTLDKYNNAQLC